MRYLKSITFSPNLTKQEMGNVGNASNMLLSTDTPFKKKSFLFLTCLIKIFRKIITNLLGWTEPRRFVIVFNRESRRDSPGYKSWIINELKVTVSLSALS